MSNVRDYLRKRAERKENKQTAKNVGNLIIKHRMAIISRTILVILLCAALGATIYVQLKIRFLRVMLPFLPLISSSMIMRYA